LRDDEDEKEKTAAADKLEAERRASQDENDRANIARLLQENAQVSRPIVATE